MGNVAREVPPGGNPEIGRIHAEAPWDWLAAGWSDLWKAPFLSLIYGAAFALIAGLIFLSLRSADATAFILILAGGFLLLGPMLAAGLYEKSRRIEAGEALSLSAIVTVKAQSRVGLAYMGVLLLVVFVFWIPIAMVIFAIFFGHVGLPNLDRFVTELLLTPEGLGMLVVGTSVGAVLAGLVFVITAVSVPMLMDRPVDVFFAVSTSIRAVCRNRAPMLLWAVIIAVFMAAGMITLFLGLIVIFPLIGHATWHAYRALVKY